MSIPKEKRTKEQTMRLLDRAIEQEESLLEKIRMLETELADCRIKAENPRHELEEQALPGSKVAFRLDYYRTEEKGPFKGIIEHLPTRERRSFEGNRSNEIGDFVAQFVGANTGFQGQAEPLPPPKASAIFPPEIIENTNDVEKKERSPLLKKLFPEFFSTTTALPLEPTVAEPKPVPVPLESEPFLVLTEGVETHQRAVRSGQPFQIQIPMQALGIFQGKPCSVSLSAKSLEKKNSNPLKIVEYYTPTQDKLNIPIHTHPLEQGVYRLIVSMALRDEPQKAYYREDRLLIVQ
ncbi:MAG: hypothetical protein H7246_17035 [Phycisphaerae bacterium]|nr:hypothetical protein [Saprospiraceae bacterium]